MANMTVLRYPEGRKKALTMSYDDAVCEDFRLIEIMTAYGLKGTFNINSAQYCSEEDFQNRDPNGWAHRMPMERATELYSREGVEPAMHGLTHPFLETLPAARIAYEVGKDRENLEAQFGKIVRGMAYPFGTWNETVVQVLADLGVTYARTVKPTHGFALPERWLTLNPTCHHMDPKFPEITERFLTQKVSDWSDGWLYYLWGHAYEFKQHNNWELIEEFAEKVGNREEIWYATNDELYDYIEAYRALIFSFDGRWVKNPTATKIWFAKEGKDYAIEPGQVLAVD